jgi:hypothetical protein
LYNNTTNNNNINVILNPIINDNIAAAEHIQVDKVLMNNYESINTDDS